MELERIKNDIFVNFTKSESKTIVQMAKRKITDTERQIRLVENNPKNEGQVTYTGRVKELRNDIAFCRELIDLLTP
jgi:hypothetical protein